MKMAIKIIKLESGKFKAICPALPGCCAAGSTPEEAARKIESAILGYLASLNTPTLQIEPQLLTA